MATSGVSTGLSAAGEVVRTAYEVRGAVSIEGDVTGSQMDFGLKQLTWMLKAWQADDRDMFWTGAEIAWPADTPEAELNTNYLDITNVRYNDQRLLERYTRDQVARDIYDKTTSGVPTWYATWRERNKLWLRLWPVPDEAVTLQVDVKRVVEDITDAAQDLDIQQEITEAVVYNLSTRLVGGDPKLLPLVVARAEQLYRDLPKFDQEGSLFLTPETYWS